MKLTVAELRQVIREVIAESPAWWEKNWAEDEDLEDLDPKIVQGPSGPLRWQDAEDPDHKVIHTKQGIYGWFPSTRYRYFRPDGSDDEAQKISGDANPRRSGGIGNMKSEEQATARVRQHMARQKK
jgi:hypothetical protein